MAWWTLHAYWRQCDNTLVAVVFPVRLLNNYNLSWVVRLCMMTRFYIIELDNTELLSHCRKRAKQERIMCAGLLLISDSDRCSLESKSVYFRVDDQVSGLCGSNRERMLFHSCLVYVNAGLIPLRLSFVSTRFCARTLCHVHKSNNGHTFMVSSLGLRSTYQA